MFRKDRSVGKGTQNHCTIPYASQFTIAHDVGGVFLSGEWGDTANTRPGSLPASMCAPMAAVQNGTVRQGVAKVAANAGAAMLKIPAAAALDPSARAPAAGVGTKKTETARALRA
eukprot:scaffold210452_cov32-Tisochrysis_lutea.AAC.3